MDNIFLLRRVYIEEKNLQYCELLAGISKLVVTENFCCEIRRKNLNLFKKLKNYHIYLHRPKVSLPFTNTTLDEKGIMLLR